MREDRYPVPKIWADATNLARNFKENDLILSHKGKHILADAILEMDRLRNLSIAEEHYVQQEGALPDGWLAEAREHVMRYTAAFVEAMSGSAESEKALSDAFDALFAHLKRAVP